MFTRRPSQKPSDDLYKSFRATFPQLAQNAAIAFNNAHNNSSNNPSNTDASSSIPTTHPDTVDTSALLADALDDIPANARPAVLDTAHKGKDDTGNNDEDNDADGTPRATNEPWQFGSSGLTPSLMDPNSHSFNLFANQLSGYYTPTPGGTNTFYHPQAGDLHTPGFALGLGTPLSMPTSEGGLHVGQGVANFSNYHHSSQLLGQQAQQLHGQQQHAQQQHGHSQLLQHHHHHHHHHPQPYQNVNPYQIHQPAAFPPHSFSHQSSLDTSDGPLGESPLDDFSTVLEAHTQPAPPPRDLFFRSHGLSGAISASALQHPLGEKFRYQVTLNAPTAMVKHADEIPITYLNKGQAYTLNVHDTQPKTVGSSRQRYRTFVRVSFEDEQQRLKPAACWQLWKEGRGTNEAHQRGGRLQAVEFVDANGANDDSNRPRLELESASFDGFCVTWTATSGTVDCPVSVRFNFLSTDFSHSKGVKGIPVRLCAKTETIGEGAASSTAEVCYCKVKLFRDHGAERKLSNDIAHVKKTIDKLNAQIAQIESGVKESGKRKRSGSLARSGSGMDSRPTKMAKHRRTWSVTSTGSASGGGRGSAEDDLHSRLMALQDMFTSTRPASVLYLRGDDEDDPDAYPVKMLGGELADADGPADDDAQHVPDSQDDEGGDSRSAHSSLESPTPTASASPEMSRRDSTLLPPPVSAPASLPRVTSAEWRAQPQTAVGDLSTTTSKTTPSRRPTSLNKPSPIKVRTRPTPKRPGGAWVEALDVDPSYQPPPDRPVKPVACFFVQSRIAEQISSPTPSTSDPYYRAIYLTQRTLRSFVEALATKCAVEPTQVLRTLRITEAGLEVRLDDECVRELPEGQDMRAEFRPFTPDEADAGRSTGLRRPKREWDANEDEIMQIDGDLSAIETVHSVGYELRLSF